MWNIFTHGLGGLASIYIYMHIYTCMYVYINIYTLYIYIKLMTEDFWIGRCLRSMAGYKRNGP